MSISRTITAMTLATLSVACSDAPTSGAAENSAARSVSQCTQTDGMIASDSWMRASRKGQPTSAAYLTLTNCSKEDNALIAVSFEGAAAAELHATNMSGEGVASMKQSKIVSIAAGDNFILEPGADHIMLIGMAGAVTQGANPAMVLEFQNGVVLDVVFDVRDATHGEDHSAH